MPQVDGKQPSFPAFSGGVSLLLSHPGWGHRLRRSYKLKYRRIESEQTVKNRALRLSPSKTKQTKEKNLFHIGKFMSENWLKLMEKKQNFPAFSGGVSLLLSHPGWGPATAELQTNNYRRISNLQNWIFMTKS